MQETIVKTWDDLHRHLDDQKVESDVTVQVSLTYLSGRRGRADKIVRLDLTDEHLGELESALGPYFRSGESLKEHRPGPSSHTSFAIRADQRAWAAKSGHTDWVKDKPGGGYSYSNKLVPAYEQAIREGSWPGLPSSQPS